MKVEIAVDVSASMGGKFNTSCALVSLLASQLPQDCELGLMQFGSDRTNNHLADLKGYEGLEVVKHLGYSGSVPMISQPSNQAQSDPTAAVLLAFDLLMNSMQTDDEAVCSIVLITNGLSGPHQDSDKNDWGKIVKAMQKQGMLLFVLLVGDHPSSELLRNACVATGGHMFQGVSAPPDQLLSRVYGLPSQQQQKLSHSSSTFAPFSSSSSEKSSTSDASPAFNKRQKLKESSEEIVAFPYSSPYIFRPKPQKVLEWVDELGAWLWRSGDGDKNKNMFKDGVKASGKWLLMIFGSDLKIVKKTSGELWDKLLLPFAEGKFGITMKMLPLQAVKDHGLICIYVRDHCDCVDVMRQLLVLRDDIGWKSRLNFKTDKATLADETWSKYHSPKVDACGKVELLLNKPSKGNGKKKVERDTCRSACKQRRQWTVQGKPWVASGGGVWCRRSRSHPLRTYSLPPFG